MAKKQIVSTLNRTILEFKYVIITIPSGLVAALNRTILEFKLT